MRFSVIVPVRDGRGWVVRAVRSALEQTERSLEVIVVDDGSADGSAELVRALAAEDPRVRLLRHDRPRGPGGARNTGLDAARGEWIAFLDADDRFHRTRLQRLLAVAAQHGADLLADTPRLVGEDGEPRGPMWTHFERPQVVGAEDWVRCNVWSGPLAYGYAYGKPVFRRALVESPPLRMRPELRLLEDFHFFLAMLRRGHRLLLVPEGHYDYTLRAQSLSRAGSTEPDLHGALQANREVLQDLPDGELRRQMERLQDTVQLRVVRQDVLRSLRRLNLPRAARLLVSHPGATRLVARAVLQRARRASERLAETR